MDWGPSTKQAHTVRFWLDKQGFSNVPTLVIQDDQVLTLSGELVAKVNWVTVLRDGTDHVLPQFDFQGSFAFLNGNQTCFWITQYLLMLVEAQAPFPPA